MTIDRQWLTALLAAAALAACAGAPSRNAGADAPIAALPSASPRQVYVTGSRIAVPVDPRTGQPQTASSLRIISPDQLSNTGYTQLGSALHSVAPELH